jgi:hypothetical protein
VTMRELHTRYQGSFCNLQWNSRVFWSFSI